MKRFHPASPADLPGSPPGGRSGQIQGENPAAGGAEGGFEVPIGMTTSAKSRGNVRLIVVLVLAGAITTVGISYAIRSHHVERIHLPDSKDVVSIRCMRDGIGAWHTLLPTEIATLEPLLKANSKRAVSSGGPLVQPTNKLIHYSVVIKDSHGATITMDITGDGYSLDISNCIISGVPVAGDYQVLESPGTAIAILDAVSRRP